MLIEGPLNIGIVENSTGGRELHLDFSKEFRALKLSGQTDTLKDLIKYLKNEISFLEEHDPNRQDMLMIVQVTEEILPHVEIKNIPLEETLVVKIQTDDIQKN